MSYHHKGGVGKSTTAVHVALRLASTGRRVLVVDGDSQAHACAYFQVDPADAETGPVDVHADAGSIHVVHAAHRKIRQMPQQAGADDVVIDLSADFEGMARVAASLAPDIALLCVKPLSGALRDLAEVVNALVRETNAEVRVVPIGVPEAEIRAVLTDLPQESYSVTTPISYVPEDAERSFAERRPVWSFDHRDGMIAEYDSLIA